MYIIQCKLDNEETYLKSTSFTDDFTKDKSNAKRFKKEIACDVAIRHLKENHKNIVCKIINEEVRCVRVFV